MFTHRWRSFLCIVVLRQKVTVLLRRKGRQRCQRCWKKYQIVSPRLNEISQARDKWVIQLGLYLGCKWAFLGLCSREKLACIYNVTETISQANASWCLKWKHIAEWSLGEKFVYNEDVTTIVIQINQMVEYEILLINYVSDRRAEELISSCLASPLANQCCKVILLPLVRLDLHKENEPYMSMAEQKQNSFDHKKW